MQLTWLNAQLDKIWPYVDEVISLINLPFSWWISCYIWVISNIELRVSVVSGYIMAQAASDLIRSNVEPILEQYTPAIFSSMKFSKLTLGTVAPQFTG